MKKIGIETIKSIFSKQLKSVLKSIDPSLSPHQDVSSYQATCASQNTKSENSYLPERNGYKDMLFGIAMGDALGVPVEFHSRQGIAQYPVTG